MNNKLLAMATVAMALAAGASAHAQNLITNGSFETGDLTGWSGGNMVAGPGFDSILAQDGNDFLAFGCVEGDCTTSQTVSDNAGDTLQLSYYYVGDGGQPSDFSVQWNGSTLDGSTIVNGPDQRSTGWTQFTFNVVATGSDTVSFTGRNDPSWNAVDNVTLTAGVPEPATWALMIGGFGLAGAALRRRRAIAAAA